MIRFKWCLYLLLNVIIISSAQALEVIPAEQTGDSAGLSFTLERTEEAHGNMYIWATISNTGEESRNFVNVILEVRDANNVIIDRKTVSVKPQTLHPGEQGVIEEFAIASESSHPAVLMYTISSQP